MKYDVIVVGAGATGVCAAMEIAAAGKSCLVIEASGNAGGRICSVNSHAFHHHIEAGAEFIHGKLPLTFELLSKAGIAAKETQGEFIRVIDGMWNQGEPYDEHWNEFISRLKKQKQDCTILQFLNNNFPEQKYHELRKAVDRFAAGFDLADISRASVLAIKSEWTHEDDPQFRVEGGYSKLISWMINQAEENGAKFIYNQPVTEIDASGGEVKVYGRSGELFESSNIIVTASPAVLQTGFIKFIPALPSTFHHALDQLGVGQVVKFIIQFKQRFWNDYGDDIGFILSGESIPTWWTQSQESRILTGWVGGPSIESESRNAQTWLSIAISSLARIFKTKDSDIQNMIEQSMIVDWQHAPFIHMGYSYATTGTEQAKNILSQAFHQKIYFAGEALSSSESLGTVESALVSGRDVAKKILEN